MVNNYKVRETRGETLLDHLLFHRGIVDPLDREAFLSPDYEKGTHDPFLFKDMQKAVDRIRNAMDRREKIVIYADYDADGLPGGAILHDFFKKISYDNVSFYIPHRHTEGFGLHKAAIRSIVLPDAAVADVAPAPAAAGATLIITVDCGISDVEEVRYAKELGADLIITDHHLPGPVLPDAFAIVDPKQPGCAYPEKMLCGAAVAFKVVQALIADDKKDRGNSFNLKDGYEKWLLDLVGIATLSDMVPLKGENRVLAYYGLKVLRKSPRLGLMKLFRSLKVSQKDVTEDDIAFLVTPRINAASRMGSPMDAFRLLTAATDEEADAAVQFLNKLNDERKGTVAALLKEIKKKVASRELDSNADRPVMVLGNPDWSPALLGLAATGLLREHNKPVFLWGRSDEGMIKGSCRSNKDIDLVELMQEAPAELFLDRGGHGQSGGYSLSDEHVHRFEDELCKAYEKQMKRTEERRRADAAAGATAEADGRNNIDAKLLPENVAWDTWRSVEQLAPFGVENPKPLFLLEHVPVLSVKRFGKAGDHLEISFVGPRGKKVSAIKFFVESEGRLGGMSEASVGQSISILAHLEKSVFRSFPELRLRIVDVL